MTKSFSDAQKFRVQIRRGRESKSYTTEFAKAYAAALKNTINEQLLNSANLVADFWYTSWVDAGKPSLSAITPNWSTTDQTRLNDELKIFKDNKLLENKLVLSKKADTKEGE